MNALPEFIHVAALQVRLKKELILRMDPSRYVIAQQGLSSQTELYLGSGIERENTALSVQQQRLFSTERDRLPEEDTA
ncbi:hypothetical protein ACFFLM_21380 [Deinococcus oregonensis]|uniref:Uncharacterized protein n=1 Tax=Deinococcus oregonensis TaxID=1805970 RepID=A0ABV6B418_9DEIO